MKNRLTKMVVAAAALGSMLAIAGCKDSGPSSRVFVKNGAEPTLRIAVIPFDAVGNVRSQDAGRVVTSKVITYLLWTGLFKVVDPGAVDEALVSNDIRITEGLRKADLAALQKALNVDGVILGLVEDYGDVRIGNDSYPSVSFSARLVNARTGEIVWAGAISRTGADKVTLFDMGRVSSMGKLCMSAVQEMAGSMGKEYAHLAAALKSTEAAAAPTGPTAPGETTPTVPGEVKTAVAAGATGKSTDESKTYGETELKALLPDIPGFTKGEFSYKKHYHDTIEGRYSFGDGPSTGSGFVEVRLADYQKVATAEKLMKTYHPSEETATFSDRPAFMKTSEFGYQHIDLAVGRFGLFIRGTAAKKAEVEKVAGAMTAAVR